MLSFTLVVLIITGSIFGAKTINYIQNEIQKIGKEIK